jgi:ribosomal protein S18 acetylase RimI-like enzyme
MIHTAHATPITLRRAVHDDVDAIATLWHRGWRDGHLGHVPTTLLRHRRLVDLRERVPVRLATTTVATIDSAVIGFVVTHADEIEQVYVDAASRGSGVAGLLLRHGEAVIGARFDRAWLAVVAGNTRARRFYERNGWSDIGAFDNPAFAGNGQTILVPARRYEKRLTPPVASQAVREAALAHDGQINAQANRMEGGQGSSR